MSYKVLHISASDSGGAGIAARRLNDALNEFGIHSRLLCLHKTSKSKMVTSVNIPFVSKAISHLPIPVRQNKYKRILKKESKNYEALTFPEAIFDISNHPLVKEADIINFHWLGGILNYPSFFKKVKKPIVWTLHDMNPFLGMAHYQGDLKANPHNSEIESKIKRLKTKAYNNHPSITIVNLCEWMKDYSSQSDSFKNREHHIIRNSLNVDVFKLRDKNCIRKALEIPDDKPVVMFCSQHLANPRKGFDLLLDALSMILSDCNLISVGNSNNIKLSEKQNIIPFGNVSDQRLLAMLYASADIFVLPSREDNLPNTMLESLCCGTPVIAFGNGGMRDIIENGINGIIVEDYCAKSLADAIDSSLLNLNRYNPSEISKKASIMFSPHNQAAAYDALYRSLLR